MRGRNVFLVDGDGDGGPWGGGKGAAAIEEIANRGASREFEGTGGARENVAEKAESEEGDAHAIFIICEAPAGWTFGVGVRQQDWRLGERKPVVLRAIPTSAKNEQIWSIRLVQK